MDIRQSQSEIQFLLNSIRPVDHDKYSRWGRLAYNGPRPIRLYPGLNGEAKSAKFGNMYYTGHIGNTNVNTKNEMFRKKTNGINRLRSTFQNPILSTHIVTLNSIKKLR